MFYLKESHLNFTHGNRKSGLALCPFDPEDNATWVWVNKGKYNTCVND